MNKPEIINVVKVAILAGTLAACSQGGQSPIYPTGAETEMRNKVEMVRMPYLLLSEQGGSDYLSKGSIMGLDSFLDRVGVRYGDTIVMDQGEDVASGRVESVVRFLAGRGVETGETDGVFGPQPARGNMMLYIERYVVELPNCPNFEQASTPDYQNAGYPNFGCSTVSALGLMVANPRDLIAGQTSEDPLPDTAVKAAKEGRTGRVIDGNR